MFAVYTFQQLFHFLISYFLDLKRLNQILLHLREQVDYRNICLKPPASHRSTTHLKDVFFCLITAQKHESIGFETWVSVLYLKSILYTCQSPKYRQVLSENINTLPTCREFSNSAISSSFPTIPPNATIYPP